MKLSLRPFTPPCSLIIWKQAASARPIRPYPDAGPLYAATVKYRGTLSQDATEIAGRWAILAIFSGKFVMTRLPGKAAEVEHKQSELV